MPVYYGLDQLTAGEQTLAVLLIANQVDFIQQPMIRLKEGSYIRPDFYLPSYKGYCEVLSSHQSVIPRLEKLKSAIKEGLKITFYTGLGKKIMLTTEILSRLNIKNNEDLFEIAEFSYYGKATITGRDYFCSSLYPEYIDNVKIKQEERKKKRHQLKTEIKDLYKKLTSINQNLL